MTRRDLERARAELHADVIVRDDGNLASEHRHDGFASDEFFVALVIGMDSHRGIAKDGLGADGRDRDVFIRSRQHIFEIIQRRVFLVVFHFEV